VRPEIERMASSSSSSSAAFLPDQSSFGSASDSVIYGNAVVLIPYQSHHVPPYHEWMKSPELLEATASEPLTLEEEYEMQKKWNVDADKATFIVYDKVALLLTAAASSSEQPLDVANSIVGMAGDVNLFNMLSEDGAEVEIMIAEPSCRRRGFGAEAVKLMMLYGIEKLNISTRYYVKIGEDNVSSQQLFVKLGFVKCNYVAAFKEIEYEVSVTEEFTNSLRESRGEVIKTLK
jgi:RimJ/RimL family protein N-acetyltransferase